ncbi:hypothetical protein HCN51_33300 [Nonomuraea sp. FMUSA5-5]|uniref:Uncharacterized protein n=1 Tax=Nonomuraea composti TaxID=2720023 RepID=A0ABX1BCZ8_9ACTN|nr:hypothetical protein [Nonomuraea sp. FMUSA5-5]NJP94259.1 hypothetical protein [Nonomuraea sp. FMUSA5-5]
MRFVRRIKADVRARKNLEAYTMALIVAAVAVVSVAGDAVPEDVRWAAVLAGVGVLLYRATLPEQERGGRDVLGDRTDFDQTPVTRLFDGVRDVRIFAPSAANLLTAQVCETLRTGVLRHPEATVRVVLLDPDEETAIRIARRQLDESDAHRTQTLPVALNAVLERLASMRGWKTRGKVEYRLFPYNPGFSLVLTDPEAWQGRAIVEMHGAGQSTFARMHVDLIRERHERWYAYWVGQFDYLWETARPVEPPTPEPEDA